MQTVSERDPLRVVHVGRTELVRELCPYLVAADGTHKKAAPARDHRCAAVEPAPPISSEKQRRLCLTTEHRACATYGAALAGRAHVPGGASARAHSVGRPYARTTPILLEHGRVHIPLLAGSRSVMQLLLAGLMAVAFVAVIVGRVPGPAPAGAVADASATAKVAQVLPTIAAVPTRTLVPVGSPSPSAGPGPTTPRGDPGAPGAVRTYKVRSGDTLSGIAARFGTTTKILMKLNAITDPARIRVGTVLSLP
jgi:hypothetical protein